MTRIRDANAAADYAARVAAHRGWVVNPDTEFVSPILEGLAQASASQGHPSCPCRDVEPGENRDIVCPCVYAAADIGEHGQCYCGLFLALGKKPSSVSSIPERRPARADA